MGTLLAWLGSFATWLKGMWDAAMANFGRIYDFVADFVQALLIWIKKLVTTLVVIIEDMAAWLLDGFLSIVVSAVRELDQYVPATSFADLAGSLPGEALQAMGASGVGEGLVIVTAALAIRFFLQLIPLVRLGS